jgi:C4-dicarboxylate transporter, DctM subunit
MSFSPRTWVRYGEEWIALAALAVMTLLPLLEAISRHMPTPAVAGSAVVVQHLTLWVAFTGAALAAGSGRLLGLSANTLLPERWHGGIKVFVCGVTAAVAICAAWASLQFVIAERLAGGTVALGVGRWVAEAIMPAGFAAIALAVVWDASSCIRGRLLAGLGLLVPALLSLGPWEATGSTVVTAGIIVVVVTALLGLPIFATLGGISLLLFWGQSIPVASVPVEMYRLVASPILPSIPLFTFAGYLLVEGGANQRLLRAYYALFGWLPGGLAITTTVVCAIFTWAGSGVTILAMGGLLLPMLVKARYKEGFSIGLINGSGSLGLLFPPSLPVILYGVYARTPINQLFIGGFLPGLLMVVLVSIWGVLHGVRNNAERSKFSAREAAGAIWEAKWELAIPVIVLVGLYGGFGTLVEAGAMTVAYAFLVECFVYKGLSLRRGFMTVAVECTTVIGGVLLIIGLAAGFTNYLVDAQLPTLLISWVREHIHSKYEFLLLLNLALLVKGSFMDVFSAIIVVVPLVTPLAASFGIDPVQFGVIFLANLELGYLTPPVGMNLCLSAYRFRKPMTSIYKSTLSFYLILLLGVLLITYIPWITLAPVRWFGQ